MRVELSPKTEKQLERLERNADLSDRVVNALYTLEENPLGGKPLHGKLEGMRSLRVGDRRIIYRIVGEENLILVIKIEKRSDVYR